MASCRVLHCGKYRKGRTRRCVRRRLVEGGLLPTRRGPLPHSGEAGIHEGVHGTDCDSTSPSYTDCDTFTRDMSAGSRSQGSRLAEMLPNEQPRSVESSLVVLDETRMVSYSRDGNALGPKTISTDGGKTWDDRRMSCSAGHRPCGGLLNGNRILVTGRLPSGGTDAYLEDQDSARGPFAIAASEAVHPWSLVLGGRFRPASDPVMSLRRGM